jgi:hypothetical protein
MRKPLLTLAILAVSLVPLAADITITQTMTMEGPAAAMMAGGQMPKTTMRIKGLKARTDIEVMGQTISTITDVAKKQVIILQSQTKTAQVVTPAAIAAGGTPVVLPKMDVSFSPTGKSQTIDGVRCDEHSFAMTLDLAQTMGQAQVPPEAAKMMEGVKMMMNGSIWIAKDAPGAGEFTAFNKAALDSNLLGAVTGMQAGQSGGLDKLMEASAKAPGLPYLTEISMTYEGAGPMVEAMKQMGPMKIIQKVASVSTNPIPDDVFEVPAGYTIEKK